MWKQHLLDDLELTKKAPGYIHQTIQTIEQRVQQAPVFFFGDKGPYRALLKKDLGHPLDIDRMRLPFPEMIFEYTSNDDNVSGTFLGHKVLKRANLVVTVEDSIGIVNFHCRAEPQAWGMSPVMAILYHGSFLCMRFVDDKLWDGTNLKNWYPVFERDMYNEFLHTYYMLQVLNARNIVTRTVTPPEKLNKARVKRKQPPLYEYKILEVVKGAPKNKDMGRVPWDYKSPSQTAFHMCRGHFKTYTEDAPLFGKYTGTFWWQPQARGSKENGVIEKEYAVSVANG